MYKRLVIIQFSLKSIFFFILFAVSPAMAHEPDSSSALFRLREAERNFAGESVMHGRNAAFAANFSDESVISTCCAWFLNLGKDRVRTEPERSNSVISQFPNFPIS